MDKLVAGNLNITSLATKFDELKALVIGSVIRLLS